MLHSDPFYANKLSRSLLVTARLSLFRSVRLAQGRWTRDILVEHDVAPQIRPRDHIRMEQIPEVMLLPEHQRTPLVEPEPLVEAEILAFHCLLERDPMRQRRAVPRRDRFGLQIRDRFARKGVESKHAAKSRSVELRTAIRRGTRTHRLYGA